MQRVLTLETLTTLGTQSAVLAVGQIALAVRFRVRDGAVECRVPTWTGVGDLLTEPTDALLVTHTDAGAHLEWLFVRGPAEVVAEPDWDGLLVPGTERFGPSELYQLIRIRPRRIELIDERRGWGFRETIDL